MQQVGWVFNLGEILTWWENPLNIILHWEQRKKEKKTGELKWFGKQG